MLATVKIVGIVIAYLWLLAELTFYHVPSTANTGNFFKDVTYPKSSVLLNQVYNWSYPKKVLLLAVPHFFVLVVFFIPLFLIAIQWQKDFVYNINIYTTVLGLLILFVGRYITFKSMLTLHQKSNEMGGENFLESSGLFKVSRNPGLDGMFMFFIGLWILLPNIYFLLGIIIYIIYMMFRVRIEEEFLIDKFGVTYDKYKKNTKRFMLFN